MSYDHITTDTMKCTVTLSREQQDAVLRAYDYGLSALSPEQAHQISCLLADLKDCIHP